MRLLHVVPSYYPAIRYGGTTSAVHGLCRALVAAGHEVHVLTTNVDGVGVSDVPVGEPVDLEGVQVRYFPAGIGRRLYRAPALGHALAHQLGQTDVVHAHSVFLWPTWAAARIAAAGAVPYLISPHGMLARELILKKSRAVKQAWIHLVERRSLARAAAVHVTSAAEAERIRELDLEVAKTIKVPNGVNLPKRPSATEDPSIWHGVAPGGRLLYLGRITWKKGLDRLITALRDLPNAVLVVAGNDEEGLTPKHERRASEAGVRSRLRFVGPVAGAAKWQLLQGADLLVLPSLFENFGIVVVEALGVGTPVVVSPGVGVAEIVARQELGLVADDDPEALADAIRTLMEDPNRRAAMGARGVQIVREHYSWSAVARSMSEAYAEILGGTAPGGRCACQAVARRRAHLGLGTGRTLSRRWRGTGRATGSTGPG